MRRGLETPPEDPSGRAARNVVGQAKGQSLEVPLWHEIAEDHGFLELRANLIPSSPFLALHIVFDRDAGGTIAWWESEDGEWMVAADVGAA
ncbi:MAG: hypothetical protein M3O46_10870 [Myxococcota bacterium]|nr:hypothetical protein [Myxococcota bacterium]